MARVLTCPRHFYNGVVPETTTRRAAPYRPCDFLTFYCLVLAVGYGCRLSTDNSFIILAPSGEELRWLEY